MKQLKYVIGLLVWVVSITSCYEEFVNDYDTSSVYFSSQRPVRTVIADRGMTIRVGVSIAGKRDVDPDDWATFEIAPALLSDANVVGNTNLTLLPQDYYILSDPNTFRVSNKNLPIADVSISFTDAFFADPEAKNVYYALPFKLVDTSVDEINNGKYDANGNEVYPAKNYSVVVVKYVSTYQGTYYAQGTMVSDENGGTTVEYNNSDVVKNITRDVKTISTNVLFKRGLGNLPLEDLFPHEGVKITVDKVEEEYRLTLETPDGSDVVLTNTEGSYDLSGERPVLRLKYSFLKEGFNYEVDEILSLRQDPSKDLLFEEWIKK